MDVIKSVVQRNLQIVLRNKADGTDKSDDIQIANDDIFNDGNDNSKLLLQPYFEAFQVIQIQIY